MNLLDLSFYPGHTQIVRADKIVDVVHRPTAWPTSEGFQEGTKAVIILHWEIAKNVCGGTTMEFDDLEIAGRKLREIVDAMEAA